jgi:peroxiredoxin Q/BCP
MQRYKNFYLFIFILNYLVVSCTSSGPGSADKNKAMANELKVGSKAPAFSLPDQDGKIVNLSDFLGKTNLVVYFYPKDESYGCTKEACSFRDNYEDFRETGAEVIGISADGVDSHRAFASHHKLPFILLSDKEKMVAEKYQVKKSLGVLPGRVTFVIDKNGIIRMIFSSQISYGKHVEEAIAMLNRLSAEK